MALAVTTDSEVEFTQNSVNEHSLLLRRAADEAKSPAPRRRNVLLCAAIILLNATLSLCGLLQALPLNQVLESNICDQLHSEDHVGSLCGENTAVQAELAILRGCHVMVSLIPGLLLAVPYSLMADKYGRKTVLCLAILGLVLGHIFFAIVCWWPQIFPARLVWMSPVFHLVGGGGTVLNSTVFSILSDLLPDDYRATGFFSLGATSLVFELIGSSSVPFLMESNPWLPISIGLSLYIPILTCAYCLPTGLGVAIQPEFASSQPQIQTCAKRCNYSHTHKLCGDFSKLKLQHCDSVTTSSPGLSNRWSNFYWVIRHNPFLSTLFATFLITVLANSAQETLLQFARKRFGWSWSQTGWIVFLQSGLALALLAVLLPAVNYMLQTLLLLKPATRDLSVTRISCVFLLAGNLVTALASTDTIMLLGISIWSLGSGFTLVLRSLIAQLVEPHHRSKALTAAAVLGTIGSAIGGPSFALCFRLGLSLSEGGNGVDGMHWLGLPFAVAAVFLFMTLLVLLRARIV